ncbi:MAG: hypothetical protein IJO18_00100 [Alphaproteobacteria bacterium]|nr:hypothetical protein [Alphaproteobacteria bacterium]
MNKKIKEFNNRRGNVCVTFDGLYYNVKCVQYSNKKTASPKISTDFAETDEVLAGEYFIACVNKLKGKPWIEPSRRCGYSAAHVKLCNACNCPRSLGGASYWEIFRATCTHRQK